MRTIDLSAIRAATAASLAGRRWRGTTRPGELSTKYLESRKYHNLSSAPQPPCGCVALYAL